MRTEFTVPGIPAAGLRGLGYQRKIQEACLAECPDLKPDFTGSVVIDIVDYVALQSLTDAVRPGSRRPALQDLTVMVTRALRGVAYLEREQIVMLSSSRRYGDAPGLAVSVSYWD
jgi:hypothetical protein